MDTHPTLAFSGRLYDGAPRDVRVANFAAKAHKYSSSEENCQRHRIMDLRTGGYLGWLKAVPKSDREQLWMYKAIFGASLSAIWADLNFVHDFGIEDSDLKLLNGAFQEVESLFSTNAVTVGRSAEHFEEFSERINKWNNLRYSNRSLSYWNLKRVRNSQKRIARAAVRNKDSIACLNSRRMDEVLQALLGVGHKSPGTFYSVYKLAEYFENALAYPMPGQGERKIARIVSASVPLFKLLERDEETIFRLSASAFEDLVAERLERSGMQVWRPSDTFVSDGGVDLIATPLNSAFPFLLAVQAKHHSSKRQKTGPDTVKEMQSVVDHLAFHAGMIVTNTEFTPDAMWWASKSQGKVQLQDIFQIRNWISGDFTTGRLREMPKEIQLTPRLKVDVW